MAIDKDRESAGITPFADFRKRRKAQERMLQDQTQQESCALAEERLLETLVGKSGVFDELSYQVVGPDPVAALLDSLVKSALEPEPPYDVIDIDIDPDKESDEYIIPARFLSVPVETEDVGMMDIAKIPYKGGTLIGFFAMPDPKADYPVKAARFFYRKEADDHYTEMDLEDVPWWNPSEDGYINTFLWNVLCSGVCELDSMRVVSVNFMAPEYDGPDGDGGEPVPIRRAA